MRKWFIRCFNYTITLRANNALEAIQEYQKRGNDVALIRDVIDAAENGR
jgi:hypothetical protein